MPPTAPRSHASPEYPAAQFTPPSPAHASPARSSPAASSSPDSPARPSPAARSSPARPARGSLAARARVFTDLIPQAVACRQTAAHLWGLTALPWSAPEAAWPVELAVAQPMELVGCLTHVEAVPAREVTLRDGVRVTTQERTALDCARWLPRPEAVAALDQFARRGIDLEALARQAGGHWRQRDTLLMADRGSASPRESWLRVVLVEAWLPPPATQIPVPLGDGRRAYLDLGWEEFKVAVEYDGHEHHSSERDRDHDSQRRDRLRALGWRVFPVDRSVFPARCGDVIEVVANALFERGWHPGSARTARVLSRIRAHRRRRW
ncbi:MAG: hypothetical protein HOV86_06785 [Thermoactinospora sp.]|nr:hypothetical protein [Thermoactinospora sp.]